MSLLWMTATARPGLSLTASWAPADSEEDIHPGDLEGDWGAKLHRPEVDRMAHSIQTHGYSPERHGKLHLNITDHGENIYNGGVHGSETPPEHTDMHHEHLLQALKDTGHGEVPVHIHDQRSEEGGEAAPRYFHGSTEEDLERIHPNHSSGGNFGAATHAKGYAYATSEPHAWTYAERAADQRDGAQPHVYEVNPRGPVEKDPTHENGYSRGNYDEDVRSKHGFDVIGEQEPSEETHQRYFQDHDEDGDEYGHGEW